MTTSTAPPVEYFRCVALEDRLKDLEPLTKDGRLYVAPLTHGPLRIQTPITTVTSMAEHFAHVAPAGQFLDFLKRTEEVLQQTCMTHADEWGISEDQVRQSFKSFFKEQDGTFKVRVDDGFTIFDEAGELMDNSPPETPVSARAILELSRVCLGKTEMGGMWKLVQLRLTPAPTPCLVDLDVELPDDADVQGDMEEERDEEEFV